jgi:hypothetical protein
MILDKETEFSDSQAVTASAISSVIDTGADVTPKNLGGSGPCFLVIQCDVAAAAAGAATVTFSLESDSTADLATSATVHASTAAIGKASLLAGTTIAVLPLPYDDYEEFLGVRYTVATGPLTAGKFSAFLTRTPQFWKPMQANNPASTN